MPSRGIRIQRSDREQAKKWAWLMATPPARPGRTGKRRDIPTTPAPTNRRKTPLRISADPLLGISVAEEPLGPARDERVVEAPEPARIPNRVSPEQEGREHEELTKGQVATAPKQLPSVTLELLPGYFLEIPHRAIHHRRYFRQRTVKGMWKLRFDHRGKLRRKLFVPNGAQEPLDISRWEIQG